MCMWFSYVLVSVINEFSRGEFQILALAPCSSSLPRAPAFIAVLRRLVVLPRVARTPCEPRGAYRNDERARKPGFLDASIEHGSSLKLAGATKLFASIAHDRGALPVGCASGGVALGACIAWSRARPTKHPAGCALGQKSFAGHWVPARYAAGITSSTIVK